MFLVLALWVLLHGRFAAAAAAVIYAITTSAAGTPPKLVFHATA